MPRSFITPLDVASKNKTQEVKVFTFQICSEVHCSGKRIWKQNRRSNRLTADTKNNFKKCIPNKVIFQKWDIMKNKMYP